MIKIIRLAFHHMLRKLLEEKKIDEYVIMPIKILLITISSLLSFILIVVENEKIPFSVILSLILINYNVPMVKFQFQNRSSNIFINTNLSKIKFSLFTLVSQNILSLILILTSIMYIMISLFSLHSILFSIINLILFFNIFINEKQKYINYISIILIYLLDFKYLGIDIKLLAIFLGIILIALNILKFNLYTKENIFKRKKIDLKNKYLFPIKYFFILDTKEQINEIIILAFLFFLSLLFKSFPVYEAIILILIFENELAIDKNYEKKDLIMPRFLYIYRSNISFINRFVLSDFYIYFFKNTLLLLLIRNITFSKFYIFIIEVCLITFLSLVYFYKYEKTLLENKKQNTIIFQYLIFVFSVSIIAIMRFVI